MSYRVEWYIPERVLLLTLYGIITVNDAEQFNEEIEQTLSQTEDCIFVLVDGEGMRASVPFERIRQTQTFIVHPRLQVIYVISSSKLTRLLLTVIFFATTANFRLFNTMDEAQPFLQRYLDRCTDG